MHLSDLLYRASVVASDRRAVVVNGKGGCTYAELLDGVQRFAAGLRSLGIGRGDHVVLLGAGSVDLVTSFHALAWVGAAAVPVDIRARPPEIAGVLDDCETDLVLCEPEYADLAAEASAAASRGVTVHLLADIPATSERDAAPSADPDDVAMLLYTSGTTGKPKGVCLSQRSVMWNGLTICLGQRLQADDVFIAVTPLSHAAAAARVFISLVHAQTLVLACPFDPERFPRQVRDHEATSTILVPTMMQDLLDIHPSEDFERLRSVVYGAAPSAVPVVKQALERWRCGLFHAYGLSEATTNVAVLPPEDHTPELLGSVGHPLPGVCVEVRSGDGMSPADVDQIGDVWVRSDKVMSGYWRRPQETSEVLVEGWLRTGDLGRIDSTGRLWLAGRSKELIIVGGNNVLPTEVEAALCTHSAVKEAAVVGQPHPRLGEVPVAFVVATGPEAISQDELVAHVSAALAPHKVPRTVVVVPSLPTTSSGKIAKKVLADQIRGEP